MGVTRLSIGHILSYLLFNLLLLLSLFLTLKAFNKFLSKLLRKSVNIIPPLFLAKALLISLHKTLEQLFKISCRIFVLHKSLTEVWEVLCNTEWILLDHVYQSFECLCLVLIVA